MVESVTKYAVFLDDPTQARYHLEKAIALALGGRPGPVLIDIPVDVQGALIDPAELKGYDPQAEAKAADAGGTHPVLDAQLVDRVLDRVLSAKRPMILGGHGIRCAKSCSEFEKLVLALNIPTATTQLGKDSLPYSNPLWIGHPGVKGDRAGNLIVQSADLILSLGCSLHSMTTGYDHAGFAPNAEKIQIDIDPWVLKRSNVGAEMKIQASVQDFISMALARLRGRSVAEGAWQARCRLWKNELAVRNEPHKRPNGQLNYYDIIEGLNELTNERDTLIADSGSAFYITGQAYRLKPGNRVIVSGALGQMGYTTSAMIGACLADPKGRVIGITGDGSVQTNIHDLAVFKYHGINAKLIIANNQGYVSIRNTQNNYFEGRIAGTDSQTGLAFPDLGKLCEAYGVRHIKAETQPQMMAALKTALETPGPCLCEIVTTYDQEIIPSVQSMRLPDGSMASKPLEDMYPFLPAERLAQYTSKI